MLSPLTLAFLLVSAHPSAPAAETFDAATFSGTIERKLKAARYMEQNCQPVSLPGWEGFETQKCTYSVKDKATRTSKSATVVLLDPTPLKLSEWLVNACKTAAPDTDLKSCTGRLFSRVLAESGGQYPVAGVVYEDLLPEDGVNEAYSFRDGTTTIVKDFTHRTTAPLSPGEIERAISGPVLRTASKGAFARPIGVTRSEYRQANPDAKVDGLDWLSTVRTEYQRAWKSDRNSLIEAWLRANPL